MKPHPAPALIAAIATVSAVGWILDIPALRAPLWPYDESSMVPITSICLFGLSLAMWLKDSRENGIVRLTRFVLSGMVLFLCGLVLIDLATPTGVPDSFGTGPSERYRVGLGHPSLVTLAFLSASALCVIRSNFGGLCGRVTGWFAIAAGVSAIAGHVLGIPALFGYWPGVSSGVASNTAVCMILAGWWVMRDGKP